VDKDKADFINDRTYSGAYASVKYVNSIDESTDIDFTIYFSSTNRFETEIEGDLRFDFIDNNEIWGMNSFLSHNFSFGNTLLAGIDIQSEFLPESYFTFGTYMKEQEGFWDYIGGPPAHGDTATYVQDRERYENYSGQDIAIYIQDSQSFLAKTVEVTLGARFTKKKNFEDILNYRAGVVANFSENIFAKALFGTAFRAPSLLEFTRNDPALGVPENEDMKTYEVQLGAHGGSYYATVTGFYNIYSNYIKRIWDETLKGTENFYNTDDYEMMGLEVESRYSPVKGVQLFANFSWLDAKNSDDTEKVPLLANFTWSAGASFFTNIGIGRFSGHSYIYGYGQREDLPEWEAPDAEVVETAEKREGLGLTDSFMILNAGASYRFTEGSLNGLEAAVTGKNLFDTKYYNQTIFDRSAGKTPWFDVPYDRRSVMLSLIYNW